MLKPQHGFIVVTPESASEVTTPGGIIVPQTQTERKDIWYGNVSAVDDDSKYELNDRVCYARYDGLVFLEGTIEKLLIKEAALLGIDIPHESDMVRQPAQVKQAVHRPVPEYTQEQIDAMYPPNVVAPEEQETPLQDINVPQPPQPVASQPRVVTVEVPPKVEQPQVPQQVITQQPQPPIVAPVVPNNDADIMMYRQATMSGAINDLATKQMGYNRFAINQADVVNPLNSNIITKNERGTFVFGDIPVEIDNTLAPNSIMARDELGKNVAEIRFNK